MPHNTEVHNLHVKGDVAADGQVSSQGVTLGGKGVLRLEYDFAKDGGVLTTPIALRGLDGGVSTLPLNAVVTRGYYEVVTAVLPTNADFSLGIPTDDAAGLKASAAASSIGTDGFHEAIQTGASTAFANKTTEERAIHMIIATNAITAGVIVLVLEYFVSIAG